jgi:hypothetical protein
MLLAESTSAPRIYVQLRYGFGRWIGPTCMPDELTGLFLSQNGRGEWEHFRCTYTPPVCAPAIVDATVRCWTGRWEDVVRPRPAGAPCDDGTLPW